MIGRSAHVKTVMRAVVARRFMARGLVAGIAMVGLMATAHAGDDSPVQSTARPLGLDLVAPVQEGGSDRRANALFRNNINFDDIVNNLGLAPGDTNWTGVNGGIQRVDPGAIVLAEQRNVRVYFIQENSPNNNALAFTTRPAGTAANDFSNATTQLMFPELVATDTYWDGTSPVTRTATAPLAPGDYSASGRLAAGTVLDFSVIPDGSATQIHSDRSRNPGNYQHFLAYASPNSRYVILHYEEDAPPFGGDYDDLVLAVDLGRDNVRALISASAPLPAPIVALLLPLLLILRRRWAAARSTHHPKPNTREA